MSTKAILSRKRITTFVSKCLPISALTLGACFANFAQSGTLLFDDFSSARSNVYVRAQPIDAGSSAVTTGLAGDYWSSRTLRIIASTGSDSKTQAWIEDGGLTVANASNVSSRIGISWAADQLPSGITGWYLTADLLSIDTGTVATTVDSVTRNTSVAFNTTQIVLNSGSTAASISGEMVIDSGIATDFELDNVRLSYTCKAITNSSNSGIIAAVNAVLSGEDQCASVPLPSSMLLLGLGLPFLLRRKCR